MSHRDIADRLKRRYRIQAHQVRYREDGKWYMHLERFPAAFLDRKGYIIFQRKEDYDNCPYLQLGQEVNIRPSGISGIPGYVTYPDGHCVTDED